MRKGQLREIGSHQELAISSQSISAVAGGNSLPLRKALLLIPAAAAPKVGVNLAIWAAVRYLLPFFQWYIYHCKNGGNLMNRFKARRGSLCISVRKGLLFQANPCFPNAVVGRESAIKGL